MGKWDIVDRPYFSDCERFAELMNVALYQGERVILPKDLVLQRRKYPSLSNNCGETERDVLMKESDFLLPTVTVVLYLREGHWEGRRITAQT